jgi:putative ABC transport system permease protein
MPEWKAEIRKHLLDLRLEPVREAEIVEELAQHLDDRFEELLARGATEEEARRGALAELSGNEMLSRELRQVERVIRHDPVVFGAAVLRSGRRNIMGDLLQDTRYGLRMLRKNPGFTAIAVLTLALGIGANTAIFSVLYGVLLKPLPYSNPDRIVSIWQATPASGFLQLGMSEPQFLQLRTESRSFDEVGGYIFRRVTLAGDQGSERIVAAIMSVGVIETLGVQPALGRSFSAEDNVPGNQRVVILSHAFWQRQLGSDAGVLGQTLRLNDNLFTVVGVMPAGFHLPEDFAGAEPAQLYLPLRINTAQLNWGSYYMRPVARLKPGVEPEQAYAEVSTVYARLREEHPAGALTDPAYSLRVQRLHDDLVSNVRFALWVLVGAVAVVLLIACANVSSLLLARAAARQKEIAVRAALGANRQRLVRQLLTESFLIALLGGGIGVALAAWGLQAIVNLNLNNVPRLGEVTLNLPVMLFTLGVCFFAALLFGLIPALQTLRVDLNNSLREEGRGVSGNRGRNRIHRVLVVSEVALAVVLVISAGLLLRSFNRMLRINPGFKVENLLTVSLNLPASRYQDSAQVTAFYNQLIERVGGLPGVTSASAASGLPLTDASGDTVFQIEGRPVTQETLPPDQSAEGHVYYWQVAPGYFKTMGIALERGRSLEDADNQSGRAVTVINKTLARKFWPNDDAIGKRIRLYWSATELGPWAEIVGVVSDIPLRQLNEEPLPEAYFSLAQGQQIGNWMATGMALVVRTDSDPLALSDAVRSEVRTLDSGVPVFFVRTVEQVLSQTVAQPRFNLILLGLFAAVALALAAVGIYGILANTVRARTHEIGIRLALGASRKDIFRLVVGQGMMLTLAGVVVGLCGAFALTRYLESLLFEVKPTDPLTFAGVALLLAGVAALACYLPARRAMQVDPMVALRYE